MDRIPSQSIELLLDADAEARMREDWRRLQAAGLSSLGAHTSPSNAPHVTLAAGPRLPAPSAELWNPLPLPVRFGGLLLFGEGERRVLARAIVPSVELMTLHAFLHEGLAEVDPLTAPGAWTPHVTLARRLRIAQLPEALAALGEETAPAADEAGVEGAPVEDAADDDAPMEDADGAGRRAPSARTVPGQTHLVAARHWDPTTRTITAL